MPSHSSIILEYFDELEERDKIEIVKDVIARYERKILEEKVEMIGKLSEPIIEVDENGPYKSTPREQLIIEGVEFPSVGAVFKHYNMKAANAYQKLRRLQSKYTDRTKSSLLKEMVVDCQMKDNKSIVIKNKPPLLHSHNGQISVG